MIAQIVYILCGLTSVLCAGLLFRQYRYREDKRNDLKAAHRTASVSEPDHCIKRNPKPGR